MSIVEQNKDKVIALCDSHKVGSLFVFGSVLRSHFNEASDIDFVVDFKDVDLYDYADNYFNFKDSLESLFNRPVDLLEERAIKNPILKQSIDSSKVLIYG